MLADDAPTFVTIHLDGVGHEAIVHMVTKAMREGGASECAWPLALHHVFSWIEVPKN